MIGVVSRANEIKAVREFFELFKTPWELFEAGRAYDVVIAASGPVPETDAKLVLVYGVGADAFDKVQGFNRKSAGNGSQIRYHGRTVPLYCNTLIFGSSPDARSCLESSDGIVALETRQREQVIVRIGYELFQEVQFLLSEGQPVANADSPALELHIQIVRDWIIRVGIPFVEIAPSPYGFRFAVSLTHDIDFIGIKQHTFDHTFGGFLYRSTVGGVVNFLRSKLELKRLLRMWKAVASLPFIHLGLVKDFWIPFEWYLKVEKGLNPTYFLIPFKGVPGRKVNAKNPEWRASPYDPTDIPQWTKRLIEEDCEIGVHGLDAWHDVESAKVEFERIRSVTNKPDIGIRIHWLLQDKATNQVLDAAGYLYDSTVGYNETIGYRAGTTQVYRPLDVEKLLQLPMHIQDGALFYSNRLGLREDEAWKRCDRMVQNAEAFGGVLTVLWHDRSHGPERFWGEFYQELVEHLKKKSAWFASGGRVVRWFQRRREINFEKENGRVVMLNVRGKELEPPFTVRVYNAPSARTRCKDISWSGDAPLRIDALMAETVCEEMTALSV